MSRAKSKRSGSGETAEVWPEQVLVLYQFGFPCVIMRSPIIIIVIIIMSFQSVRFASHRCVRFPFCLPTP